VSYPLDLDETPTGRLREEIARREDDNLHGLCSYCHRPHGSKPACRFEARHYGREL